MINPDVWKLEAPPTLISHKYGNLSRDTRAQQELEQKIYSHHFNEIVSVKKLPTFLQKLCQKFIRNL